MSRPESVSSIRANFGSSIAICRISQRFFSPPEKPVVDRAGGEFPVDLQQVHLLVEFLVVGGRIEVGALAEAGLQRGADEVGDRHAGDLAWVLKGQEEPGAGAFIGLHGEHRLAVEKHVPPVIV